MASFHLVVLGLAAVAATLFTASLASVDCPFNYIEPAHSGKCYSVFSTKYTWDMAQQICAGEGGWLATARDQTHHNYLIQLFKAMAERPCARQFWVGANDKAAKRQFVWAEDGSSLIWDHFAGGEPNNNGNAGVRIDTNGWWYDVDTQGPWYCFICETNPI